MTDFLQLDDWITSRVDERDDQILSDAIYTKYPEACIECGVIGKLYKHGPRPLTILDSPVRGKPSRIVARVQRYKCRDCGATFPQPLGEIDSERRMTERCVKYIEQQCLRDTFQHLSEHLGCDEKTIRNVTDDYLLTIDDGYKPYLPEWIGLDETHLNKIFRGIITDVGNRKPVDMLIGREKPELIRWFSQFKDRSHVKALTIDMWKPYKDIAEMIFNDLPIIVDKFHVVKKANECLEDVRIRLGRAQDKAEKRYWMRSKALLRMRYSNLSEKQRLNLRIWMDNEPDIAVAYRFKERLYDLYDLPKAEAIREYDAFLKKIPPSIKADFKDLTTCMKNWRKEILNYFDYPITNAFTEGMNGVAKVMNRMGRGYSFEIIRARLLFNGRKPSSRQLRAQRLAAERGTIKAERRMMACQCCCGVFGEYEMVKVDHWFPYQAADDFDPDRPVYVCSECHDRFHPRKRLNHESHSTE